MVTLKDVDLQKITPQDLGELLIEAKKAYYTGGKPIMDDHTYDTLEDILRQKNPYHRIFTKIGNNNFDTGFDKKHHIMPMGSQNKVSTYTDLVHYFELKKIIKNEFVVQPKCDGLSLEIEYQQGRVVDAITRGDGAIGDVITQNVVKMQNFCSLLHHPFSGSIRCEIVMTNHDFDKLNKIISESTVDFSYSNPRNAASGISQRLDSRYSEFCTLIPVDIYPSRASDISVFHSETEKTDYIKSLGITPVDSFVCFSFEEIELVYQKFLKGDRDTYGFDIDGLVVKINNLEIQHRLGSKNNRPKGQVAYKFPSRTDQTRIVSVNWQTGPLGTVTPVAQVDPIEISGAVITFASLANFDLVKELDLNIGDIIEISRRGDVIPHIEKVISKVNPGHLEPPLICPSCATVLIVDTKFLRCPNSLHCPAQVLGCLRLFCDTLEIKGISDKTIEKLSLAGKVKLPGDFYELTVDDFIGLAGLGEKSGKNIISQIQAKRKLTLKQVFDAAVIPNFSAARIEQLISAGFDTPEKILNLAVSDLEPLPGFQITLAAKIVEGIKLRQEIIRSILSQIELIQPQKTSQKLNGLTFVITGQLSRPRKAIEDLIQAAGGKTASAVSKNTSYLVTNETDSGSSKFQTAGQLGIPVISEEELNKLLS